MFGNTKVVLSQHFVKKMPDHINKTKILEETLSSLSCAVSYESDCQIFSLEGLWNDIVRAQDILVAASQRWLSGESNQIKENIDCSCEVQPTQVSIKNSLGECDPLNQRINVPTPIEVLCEQADLDSLQTCRTDKRSSEMHCEQDRHAVSLNSTSGKKENRRSINECDSNKCETLDTSNGNELCVDIQLEHNYNHFKAFGTIEPCSETTESAIENEIYMDIQLSNLNDKIFSNPDLPVTLVVAKEDEPGVEVVQLNMNKCESAGVTECVRKSKSPSRSQEQLRLQRKKYEENTPYKFFCSQCSFKTKRHSHMRKHNRLHEKVCTIYSCEQCDFSTIRSSHLQRHIGTHKTEVFACSECTFSTHTEALLTKHQRYKHILKKTEEPMTKSLYQCLHCDYSSASEKIFERHLSVHSKKGQLKKLIFKCSKCTYQTPSRPNYLRHLHVHGDERPFMCSTCGLCFKRSDTLAQHQVVHSELKQGQGSFYCPKCKKCCRSASSLKDHLLTHEQDRRFLCEICAASFKTRAVQRKHYNEKHVHEKMHSCSSCSKSFSSKYLLKRHMKVHAPNVFGAESHHNSALANVWCNSSVPIQTPTEDVQVIVVHQEPSESEVSVQEGPLFQITSSLVPGQTLSVPVIPVEYVVPAAETEALTTNSEAAISGPSSASHFSSREEEIISLTFVPDNPV